MRYGGPMKCLIPTDTMRLRESGSMQVLYEKRTSHWEMMVVNMSGLQLLPGMSDLVLLLMIW